MARVPRSKRSKAVKRVKAPEATSQSVTGRGTRIKTLPTKENWAAERNFVEHYTTKKEPTGGDGGPTTPPVTPAFLWDFREELSLGPFLSDPDDHRASGATGPDNEGIIREVGDNVPVFPGARVEANFVPDFDEFTANGSVSITAIGDGEYQISGLGDAGDPNSAIYNAITDIPTSSRPFRMAVALKAASPPDAGKWVLLHMRRVSGGVSVAHNRNVQLTADYQYFEGPIAEGVDDNMGWWYRISGASAGETCPTIRAKEPGLYYVGARSNQAAPSYIPFGSTVWLGETNENSVQDEASGIVTENPGVPIEGIKGAQLEGERTNIVAPIGAWSTINVSYEVSATLVGKDGGDAHVFTSTGSAQPRADTTGTGFSAGDISRSIYIHKASTAPYVAIDTFQPNALAVVDVQAGEIVSMSGTATAAGVVDAGDWWHCAMVNTYDGVGLNALKFSIRDDDNEANDVDLGLTMILSLVDACEGAFPSSHIPTLDNSGVTRAATKAIAPFTSIPELDDEGLANNFSWRAVFELRRPLDASGGAQVLVELYGSETSYLRVETSSVVAERITLTMNKGGTTATINFDGVTAGFGDILDLRGRASFTDGVDCWLNGVKGTTIANTNDFLTPIDTIALNGHTVGGDECFTIGQIVRVVPEALSDDEISSW